MATENQYKLGADAAMKVITADINSDVPFTFRGMIPAELAPQLSQQIAKVVIDAVWPTMEPEPAPAKPYRRSL